MCQKSTQNRILDSGALFGPEVFSSTSCHSPFIFEHSLAPKMELSIKGISNGYDNCMSQ